ncbi:MAG: hypothetical protein NDJ94_18815 [Vicinamibacteria bacterium]|nr:hypothetical protein [Vicinamibacteria bacterium]
MSRVLGVVAGITFMVVWIAAHAVWASLSFMASVMANDSGAASAGAHMLLIFGMLGGQVLAAAAGIPAGLAFFWRDKRRTLLIAFAILFVAGAVAQIVSFSGFFTNASPR